MCKYWLEMNAVYPIFNKRIRDFNFDLIPIANDLLSMELNNDLT
jgi:hypothetical protein